MHWLPKDRVSRFVFIVLAGWASGFCVLASLTWGRMPPAKSPELFVQTGHSSYVTSVAWSADGKTLASGSWDNTIKLWDGASGQLLWTLRGHSNYVSSVAWSADGKTFASGSGDKTIKLWDGRSGQLLRTLSGHSSFVFSVAWSADGTTLASGSADKTIKLWDGRSGQLLRTLSGHSNSVTSVAWSADGKTLASGSADHKIKLWDGRSGQLLRTLSGHSSSVSSVAWSADGKTLASGSWDNTIKLWDGRSGHLLRTLSGHSSRVYSVAWSADGKALASGSEDHTIKLWDGRSGHLLRTLSGHSSRVYSVAWSADGKALASGSEDHTIKLWDGSSGQLLRTLSGHSSLVSSVAWSADGKTLASGSEDNTIKLWDGSSGQLLRTLSDHSSPVYSVAWSADGKTLASGGEDHTIKLWDGRSGHLLRTLSGHSSRVYSIAWSADGKTLASGSEDHTIKLWDGRSGQLLRTLSGHSSPVYSVPWNADGKTLASGSFDNTIKLWDGRSGQLLRTLSGHSSLVSSVAWSADGKTLASGSFDNTIKLWDGRSGQLLRTLSGHSSLVSSVAWSADGKTLASGSWDNTIKLWAPDRQMPIREFDLGERVLSLAWNPAAPSLAAAIPTSIHIINGAQSTAQYPTISQFEAGEWLSHRPGSLRYLSSLQGDEHAAIRFDHRLRGLYPLTRYRRELHAANLPDANLPVPALHPIFTYDLGRIARDNQFWLSGFAFGWFAVAALIVIRSNRLDPALLARNFFGRARNASAESILWPSGADLPARSARSIVYVLFSEPAPSPDQLQKLRNEKNIEPIPVSLARIERAIAEDNCAQTLAEIEEPFTTRQDPYDEGVPIKDETWFYGRRDLLDRLSAALRQGQHAGIFGIRKVGKTSLLYQLRDRLLRNTLVVLLDCQGYGANAGEYFGAILEGFRAELNRRLAKPVPAASGSFREQFLALRAAWQEAGSREVFVLILDEADRLFPDRRQTGSLQTLAEAVQLFRVLRALAQEHQAVSLVLCGYRADSNRQNLLDATVGENPLHMSLQENFLKFLSPGEAKAMVREIGGWKEIEWTDAALDRIYEWCAGHPLVTRLFASDCCERGNRKQIDEARVAEVAASIVRDFRKHRIGIYFRESIWGILYPDEQECLRQVAAGETIVEDLAEARINLEQFGLMGEENEIQGDLLKRWLERQ